MARTKQTAKKTTGAIGQRADIPPPTTTSHVGAGQTGTPLQAHTASPANTNTEGFIAFTSEDLGEDNPVRNCLLLINVNSPFISSVTAVKMVAK